MNMPEEYTITLDEILNMENDQTEAYTEAILVLPSDDNIQDVLLKSVPLGLGAVGAILLLGLLVASILSIFRKA